MCIPILERESGLVFNRVFFAGYSPERINPGVKQHRPATIDKVTAGTHQEFRTDGKQRVRGLCRKNHVLYDIKRSFPAAEVDGRP